MKNLTDIEYVKTLKANLRTTLETDAGKKVIEFLEDLCGWYDFNDSEVNDILIKHGGRRILATLKTVIKLSPEQVVALAIQKEQ